MGIGKISAELIQGILGGIPKGTNVKFLRKPKKKKDKNKDSLRKFMGRSL